MTPINTPQSNITIENIKEQECDTIENAKENNNKNVILNTIDNQIKELSINGNDDSDGNTNSGDDNDCNDKYNDSINNNTINTNNNTNSNKHNNIFPTNNSYKLPYIQKILADLLESGTHHDRHGDDSIAYNNTINDDSIGYNDSINNTINNNTNTINNNPDISTIYSLLLTISDHITTTHTDIFTHLLLLLNHNNLSSIRTILKYKLINNSNNNNRINNVLLHTLYDDIKWIRECVRVVIERVSVLEMEYAVVRDEVVRYRVILSDILKMVKNDNNNYYGNDSNNCNDSVNNKHTNDNTISNTINNPYNSIILLINQYNTINTLYNTNYIPLLSQYNTLNNNHTQSLNTINEYKNKIIQLECNNKSINNDMIVLSKEYYKLKSKYEYNKNVLINNNKIIGILQNKYINDDNIISGIRCRIEILRNSIKLEKNEEMKNEMINSLRDYEKRLRDFLEI